jgi:hypothetical protein
LDLREESHDLYSTPNTVKVMKDEIGDTYSMHGGNGRCSLNLKGKDHLGDLGVGRGGDNIKMELRNIVSGWELASTEAGEVQWRGFVNMVMNLEVQ